MRTIDKAIDELKQADPGCALTKNALRQMVIFGRVPSVNIGSGKGTKYLIDMDALEAYLKNPTSQIAGPDQLGKIRRVC